MTVLAPHRSAGGGSVFALTAALPLLLLTALLAGSVSSTSWAALFIGPILFAVSYPVLARIAREEQDPKLLNFLLLALAIKLLMTIPRFYMISELYGRGDALDYDAAGQALYEGFRGLDFDIGDTRLSGTRFIEVVTGGVYALTGPTMLGGFMVFSWLAYWGMVLWYRAFVLAVPDGDRRTYRFMVFLFPSVVFWPSSAGKEAWMMLSLGLAAYAIARIMTRGRFRGIVYLGIGLWMGAFVRPHFSVLIIVAAAVAAALRGGRAGPSGRGFGLFSRVIVVGSLLIIASLVIGRAESFFGVSSLSSSSVEDVLSETQRRSSQGGSEFSSEIVTSPAQVPAAVTTVLFRPFPTEAHNAQALIAAMEGTFLFGLVIWKRRGIYATLRRFRELPYATFGLAYLIGFSAAFAAIGNFGIVNRQRVLVLPALFVILATKPRDRSAARA